MSGSYFGYNVEDRILGFLEDIKSEDLSSFSSQTREKINKSVIFLKKAALISKEIDYLLSSDNCEESFNNNYDDIFKDNDIKNNHDP